MSPLSLERERRADYDARLVRRCSRPEQDLIRCCARTRLDPSIRAAIREMLDEEINWDYLIHWASGHCVVPLLHRRLQEVRPEAIPKAALKQLNTMAQRTAMYNLHRLQELFRLLKRLDEQDIRALPFKGPVLSLLAYGDVSLRQFGDLDLLIPKNRFEEARQVLVEDGYRPYSSLDAPQEGVPSKAEKSYELVRGDVMVELHWDFLHPVHGFYLDPHDVLTRARPVMLGTQRILTLAPEDLVLYLCTHGSKHFWSRLSWVCDLAEVLRTRSHTLYWPTLLKRAEALNARRMLFLGLTLAHEWLSAPCPPSVAQAAARDDAVRELVTLSKERLCRKQPEASWNGTFDGARRDLENAHFHLLMRERLRDRLPYYRHLLYLALMPSAKDRRLVNLPPALSSLYYFVRPFRVLRDASATALNTLRHQRNGSTQS